jgi:hypothetical protein
MTFGPDHYVPILKMKRGEKRALAGLSPAVAGRMTPLLEIVEMDGKKSVSEHIATSFKDLPAGVAPFKRYFLDAGAIAIAGPAAASGVFKLAAEIGIPFTPVTGISRTADVDAARAHREVGTAIRLTREEFEAGKIPTDLPIWLAANSLVPQDVDLILDLGAVDDMVAAGVMGLSAAFLADVPHQSRWRTLTVSACAFPASMGVVDRHSHIVIDRIEWQAWRDDLYSNRATLTRLPTFSDGAIQHPRGVEGFDPLKMQVSASVRYTLRDQWLLIKGESTRNVRAGEQFPSLATQLVYGHLSRHFAGSEHCSGCTGIQKSADGATGLGSAEAWRRLGTTHHLTRAVEEIALLPWP